MSTNTFSTLPLTYRESICRKHNLTTRPLLVPVIDSLSGYVNKLKGATIITIFGGNFRDYSIVYFGTVVATSVFINSEHLQIFIPQNYNSGIYSIQVINDQYNSNVVDYTLA